MTFDYDAQPKEQLTQCNLCGTSKFVYATVTERYGFRVGICTCENCGLMFINPRMTKEAYRDFYGNGHYRQLIQDSPQRMGMELFEFYQARYANKVISYVAPYAKPGGVLLDVGGSTGKVAAEVGQYLQQKAVVLEPAGKEADRAEWRGLDVIRASIEEVSVNGQGPLHPESFDVILLCQTVDHLLDISGALRTIRELLKPGGVFYVDAVWNCKPKIDHPYYLDDLTAPRFLTRAGFQIITERRGDTKKRLNYVCGVA